MANREFWGTAGTIAPLYGSLGAFSLIFQTILLREFFTVAAGNEISIAVALGSWLLGVGAGSAVAGMRHSARRPARHGVPSVAALLCVTAPRLLVVVRCLQRLTAVPLGTLIPLARTFWLVPLLTVPFSFFSGFAFPLAAGLEPASFRNSSQKMVRAYVWECFGALAAGVLYTFWLVEILNPMRIIAIFALPLLLASAFAAAVGRNKKALGIHWLLLAVNLYAILGGGAGRLDAWLVRQRWLGLSAATWVESRDSKFQNLQLGLSHGQYGLYGNGQLAAVFPDDDAQRIQAAQIITQHPQPRNVLVIGEGASGLAGQLLRFKLDRLTAVELDNEFLDMILDHLPDGATRELRDPRLSMLVTDGRRFVMEAARAKGGPENRFDLVYLNQPDAWTAVLNRYYTREFFQELRAILNEGGVVSMRLTAAENYASEITHPYTGTIYQTLKSVFPFTAVSPGPLNFISASPLPARVSDRPQVLAERYRRLARPPADLAWIFASLYPAEKTAFNKNTLDGYRADALNRDGQPIAYFLFGRRLGWSSGSPLAGGFDFFKSIGFGSLLAIMVLPLAAVLLVALLRRRDVPGLLPPLLAAAGGGFAGLALEIMTVFTFQNLWGHVYQAVGLLIAVFMLGMGVGAALTNRRLEKKPPGPGRAATLLAVDQLLIAGALLAFQPLTVQIAKMAGWTGQVPLFLWLGSMGFLIGAILPLGLRISARRPPARQAGLLNAADYLGGAVGALATASLLLPLYGSASTLLLISVPALTAALLLLVESQRGRWGRVRAATRR